MGAKASRLGAASSRRGHELQPKGAASPPTISGRKSLSGQEPAGRRRYKRSENNCRHLELCASEFPVGHMLRGEGHFTPRSCRIIASLRMQRIF
jgi:hypothetical protein